MKEFLKFIFRLILIGITIYALLIGNIILICLIKNWVSKIIIAGISGVLLLSIAFIYSTAEEKVDRTSFGIVYPHHKNDLKIINKCKILKSKIINLLSWS